MPKIFITDSLHYHVCPCGWNSQYVNDQRRLKMCVKLHDKKCPLKDVPTFNYNTIGTVPKHLDGCHITHLRGKEDQIKLKN